MFNQEEIRAVLKKNPENFQALYVLACDFRQKYNYGACFAMADRAIASYEAHPVSGEQGRFFELKRLHSQMLREHMESIIGPGARIIDSRWMPVFKLGRPREIALNVSGKGISLLPGALCAPQLKRLRYLNIVINDNASTAVEALIRGKYDTLRALNISFNEMPDAQILKQFFESQKENLRGIISFKIHLPQIDDDLAMAIRESFSVLEYFTLESSERCMTESMCEYLADDERSKHLMRLGLVGSEIGDRGLFAIFSSENFPALQVLDVHDGVLSNNAARILVEATSLPSLRSVDLRYNQIDPAGLNMLKKTTVEYDAAEQHKRPAWAL